MITSTNNKQAYNTSTKNFMQTTYAETYNSHVVK